MPEEPFDETFDPATEPDVHDPDVADLPDARPDAEPVLVIHGVAMRNQERVRQQVMRLNKLIGPDWRFVPVYWGDLATDMQHLERLIGRHDDRSESPFHWLAEAADYVTSSPRTQAQAWMKRARGRDEEAEDFRDEGYARRREVRGKVHGFVHDRFRTVRMKLTQWSMPFIADVITYQSPTVQARIHERVRSVLHDEVGDGWGTAEKPIRVMGHSLGGVIGFDLAVRQQDTLHTRQLLTLGSQPALFHVLDPRSGVPPFDEEPVALPPSIGDWHNIWDDYDLLAFSACEVFTLNNGEPPIDVHVRCFKNIVQGAAFMQSHLGYWERENAVKAIRRALNHVRS